jgi:oligoendopeptidase F
MAFHASVENEVLPVVKRLEEARRERLGLDALRPWDLAVDVSGEPPLRPFKDPDRLVDLTVEVFEKLDPYFAGCIRTMQKMGRLDLASREGKAPGGYNYPLYESGAPFIFMNATSTLRDLVTILHEGGHAVHSFLTQDLELNDFKNPPSEIAELASMAMELITMDHWDLFFANDEELKRAKKNHLEQIIETLPWVATIDKFQHWIYEHPNHTIADREKEWVKIYNSFTDQVTDWEGLEAIKSNLWQRQLHLFEVPLYYIEYAIAQLGAIAVWRNFKINPQKAIVDFTNALSLGYTRTIGEIYRTAGIRFDFSTDYVIELAKFINNEIGNLK